MNDITAHFAPFENLKSKPLPLRELASRHRDIVKNLSADVTGTPAAFTGWDGSALVSVFDEIDENAGATNAFSVSLSDYPELFDAIAMSRAVRRPGAPGARVRIYGPLEARLQQADRVVLGNRDHIVAARHRGRA